MLSIAYDTTFRRLVCLQDIKGVYHFSELGMDGSLFPVLPIPGRGQPVLFAFDQQAHHPLAWFLTGSENITMYRQNSLTLEAIAIPWPVSHNSTMELITVIHESQSKMFFSTWKSTAKRGLRLFY